MSRQLTSGVLGMKKGKFPEELKLDLISWHSFNNTLNDSSGNELNGSALNEVYADGIINKGFDLTSNNIVTVNHNALYDFGTGEYTLSSWIKADKNEQVDSFIYSIFKDTSGFRLYYRVSDGAIRTRRGSSSFLSPASPTNCITGDWVHTAISFKSNGFCQFFANGESDGELEIGTGNVNNTSELIFGSTTNFIGLIDEVAIWNRALTQEEIKKLYNNGNGITL